MGDDGQVSALKFDELCCLKTVHDGHFKIHKHHVDLRMMLNKFYCLPSVFGTDNVDVFAFEVLFKKNAAQIIIFSYKKRERTAEGGEVSGRWAVGSGQMGWVIRDGEGKGASGAFN